MIFIGPELSDPYAHFVTNIVAAIGTGDDLIIDLYRTPDWQKISDLIANHLQCHHEQYIIYNAYEDEDFFVHLKKSYPQLQLITVFSDDEWRYANYDRYLALYSDIFTIAVKSHLKAYCRYGVKPFYMQWACNPGMFYPVPVKTKNIDVSFIGAAYGKRVEYIKFLVASGIQVKVFGRGWKQHLDSIDCFGGYLTYKQMLDVISRSKINLNFLWTSAEKERCTVKARTLELSACRVFQLSNHTDEFSNYGFVDKENIAIFSDKINMLEKVRYYLQHHDECETIAQQAYEHVLQHHTWKQRFSDVFESARKLPTKVIPQLPIFRVAVLLEKDVRHQISCDDDRMVIKIIASTQDFQVDLGSMDGVISLSRDSSINNESLYMMTFGLWADKSDFVAANFYVGDGENRTWIRFRDRLVEKKRHLLRLLPQDCLMFSGDYFCKYGCTLPVDLNNCKVSYVEYPSFELALSYFQARRLRLYFEHHRDPRKLLRFYLRQLNWGKALALGVDKVWQKWQDK